MECDLLVIADVVATVVGVGVPLLLTAIGIRNTVFAVDSPVAHNDATI